MSTPAERVLGIGGLFFRSRDPEKLTQWYQVHLGIDQPSWQQGWMVNFRVRSFDAMVAQLQKFD